jgi:putative hydrolase of the HAD superfamily
LRPTWIFDLDDTLHDASHAIFPKINQLMTLYIMQHLGLGESAAQALRTDYYLRYGATLLGLVRHHAIDPDHFLRATHLTKEWLPLLHWDHQIGAILAKLPGDKFLLSNGPQFYIEQLLRRMGIRHHFSAVYGVDRVGYHPKPDPRAMLSLCAQQGLAAPGCIMVEDSLANLLSAKALGMRTVWLSSQTRRPGFVDARIAALRQLARLHWL